MGYKTVTEMPGNKATKENLNMLYTRYKWALQFVQGKDVLEAGCGAGQGLGFLAQSAKKIVGGDVDEEILKYPREHYKERIEIVNFDAHNFPFENNSFDTVILFETIYYLKEPKVFLKECCRVLRDKGLVLICQANKERPGFNPSPFAFKYFSAGEFQDLFLGAGFNPKIFGAFPTKENSFKGRILSFVRKVAVKLHLIPKTMRGKEKLKRLFFGKLKDTPLEIKQGMADYEDPVLINPAVPCRDYKVLFILAEKC